MTTMIIIAISVASILILLSYTISHKNNYPITFTSVNDEGEKRSQYECGLSPFEEELGIETRERFYIKFYIIGILFLIFDLETLLLFPASLLFSGGLQSVGLKDYSPTSLYSLSIHNIPSEGEVLDSNFDSNLYFLSHNLFFLKSFSVLLIFILILLLGLLYEYRKKVL